MAATAAAPGTAAAGRAVPSAPAAARGLWHRRAAAAATANSLQYQSRLRPADPGCGLFTETNQPIWESCDPCCAVVLCSAKGGTIRHRPAKSSSTLHPWRCMKAAAPLACFVLSFKAAKHSIHIALGNHGTSKGTLAQLVLWTGRGCDGLLHLPRVAPVNGSRPRSRGRPLALAAGRPTRL